MEWQDCNGMKNKFAYYARPISIDNTPQSERDHALIRAIGFEPYPTGKTKAAALKEYRKIGMEAFRPYLAKCSLLVFRAFPDGSIGAGVGTEISWARDAGIAIVEIPRQTERRILSVDDTRAMLAELGQR